MRQHNEKFEYLSYKLPYSSHKDYEKTDVFNSKYKDLLTRDEYSKIMLNALGEVGWELVTILDDSPKDAKEYHFFFKRSSDCQYFGTGLGVDINQIERLAKEKI